MTETTDKSPDHIASDRMLDRMLFFSDAVFAIVLTLLVLELRPPAGEDMAEADIVAGIRHMTVSFASFAISFALGGMFWLAHMQTTRRLVKFDWPTAMFNLLHLLGVALLPFAAAILGEHINSKTAFEAYSLVIVLTSLSGGLLWMVASRGKGRLVGGASLRQRIGIAIASSGIGLCFLAGLVASNYGQVTFARFCWVLMGPVLIVSRLIRGKPLPSMA